MEQIKQLAERLKKPLLTVDDLRAAFPYDAATGWQDFNLAKSDWAWSEFDIRSTYNITEFILPSWCGSALINDDRSGLSDDDEKNLNEWLERTKPGWCVDMGETYFSGRNDMTSLAGDVAVFTFRKH